MRKVLKILAGIAVAIGVGVGVLLYATSGARDIARAFVMELSTGNAEAAHAYLHDGLKMEYTVERLQAGFVGYAPYEEVSFSSVSSSGGSTELVGRATTASGCRTEIAFRIAEDRIIGFNLEPLCPE